MKTRTKHGMQREGEKETKETKRKPVKPGANPKEPGKVWDARDSWPVSRGPYASFFSLSSCCCCCCCCCFEEIVSWWNFAMAARRYANRRKKVTGLLPNRPRAGGWVGGGCGRGSFGDTRSPLVGPFRHSCRTVFFSFCGPFEDVFSLKNKTTSEREQGRWKKPKKKKKKKKKRERERWKGKVTIRPNHKARGRVAVGRKR